MEKKKNINPWIIGTGSGILAVLGIRLIDFLVGTEILSAILKGIVWTFTIIGRFFTQKFEVTLWFLILLPVLIIGLIFLVFWIISKFQEDNSESSTPQISFLNFTQENFNGILYRWEYQKHYSGKYHITNISLNCPACKCTIVYDICPVCRKYYGQMGRTNAEIEALIRHRIENINQYGY
jgi:hypothetical protein